ncbi:membrane protein [Salinimicrobium xinjiangense]|uniref:membrane protein n=1 Tax=Salinimicrobium xinjiangense TaxID=438596 RepID=UPI000411050D|nr:membrane protein [Salinimicrobium xinjiangense]
MEVITWARIIHVLAVVIWIGGVAMVTMVIIPAVKKLNSKEDKIDTFERIEGKFANIAKVATILTALSGFYILHEMNAWNRYLDPRFWWIHAMTIIWLIFTVILFILEPLLLHRLFRKYTQRNPEKTFRIMHRAHWVLLILSFITIIGATAGSHGLYFF